jgi:predicted N-acetyltransferase YhbS
MMRRLRQGDSVQEAGRPETASPDLDGPRLVRREEVVAARRLGVLCFSGFVEEVDEEALLAAYRRPRRGGTQVICHRGVPVAKIGLFHSRVNVHGSPLRVGSIGGVCTHPDYRGLGLATRLLDHCTRTLVAEGARLMLISGTRGLYTRAGCVPAQRFERIVLGPGAPGREVGGPSVRPATAADAAACACLYRKEPVRFVRKAGAFTRHVGQKGLYPRAGNWMVETGGRPVAYLFLGHSWEAHSRGDLDLLEVVEYAGDRTALVGGLGELVARTSARELCLFVPWQDEELRRLLRARGFAGELVPLPGHTMRIINLPGLASDLGRHVRARLTARQRRGLRFEQDGGRLAIVRGRQRIELDGAAMTRLVMGAPAGEGPPVAELAGALQEVVAALFPLPSLLPGLNFR